jgi:hypothetical protein
MFKSFMDNIAKAPILRALGNVWRGTKPPSIRGLYAIELAMREENPLST